MSSLLKVFALLAAVWPVHLAEDPEGVLRACEWNLANEETSLLQVERTVNLGSLRSSSEQSLHPWKSFARLSPTVELVEATIGEEVSDVYFLRHGQNIVNKWLVDHFDHPIMFPQTSHYFDGGLTELGMQQAVLAQDILDRQLSLTQVPASSVQLASSLNARAYDTLVVASAPLWQSLVARGVDFALHGLPAAMEIDDSINSRRKPGLMNDDPVRWEDSALSGDFSKLARSDGARELFYETPDGSKVMTTKASAGTGLL